MQFKDTLKVYVFSSLSRFRLFYVKYAQFWRYCKDVPLSGF